MGLGGMGGRGGWGGGGGGGGAPVGSPVIDTRIDTSRVKCTDVEPRRRHSSCDLPCTSALSMC